METTLSQLKPDLDATYLNKPCTYKGELTVIICTDTSQDGNILVCIPVPIDISEDRTLWVKVDDVEVQHNAVYLSHALTQGTLFVVMYNYPLYEVDKGVYVNMPFSHYPAYKGNGEKYGAVGLWKVKK